MTKYLRRWIPWLLIILLTFFYYQAQTLDYSVIDQKLTLVAQMKQVNNALNQEILNTRFNLSKNYDALNQAVLQFEDYTRQFQLDVSLGLLQKPEIQQGFQTIMQWYEEKKKEVDQFKAQNAILKNSLTYVPQLAVKIQPHLPENSRLDLEHLLQETLIYNIANEEEHRRQVYQSLQKLESVLPLLSVPLKEELFIFMRHTQNLVTLKPELDRLIQQLLEMPLPQVLENFTRLLTQYYDAMEYQAKIYRLLLYSVSIALFLYVLLSIIRLKLSEIALMLANSNLQIFNTAFERFVPNDFLVHLNKKSIVDIALGDNSRKEMTVLFSDIRSFTTLSEQMTPDENFSFLNAYLSRMEPIIHRHKGFIDKYIGDAIMALFSGEIDDAVQAGIEMVRALNTFNQTLQPTHQSPVRMGVGIHHGTMIMGTIGGERRMETTVISDTVNIAARLEGMTKIYGVSLLITDTVHNQLKRPSQVAARVIDRVQAKGKKDPVTIFEVYNGDTPECFEKKLATRKDFQNGVALYYLKEFEEARQLFQTCLSVFPEDQASLVYLNRCEHYLKVGWDDDWDRMTRLETK